MRVLEQHGFLRAAIISPELRVADVNFNTNVIMECMERADDAGVRLAVFPELSITGYTCGDLFAHKHLLEAAKDALIRIAEGTSFEPVATIVGLPLEVGGRLYNCAAIVSGGDILGIVPKTYLPNTAEFYEQRWFASAWDATETSVQFGSEVIPFGTDLLFKFANLKEAVIGIELCEDLWAPEPPSGRLALAGATVIANPSASPEHLGKAGYRRDLVLQQSARTLTGYLYATAGGGESTTDLVYSGHGIAAESGTLLAEQPRFGLQSRMDVVDIDVERLVMDRMRNTSFKQSPATACRTIEFSISDSDKPTLLPEHQLNRPLPKRPFVPENPATLDERCEEIFHIQTGGLIKRMQHTGSETLIIGLSGGLDSTLAALVCAETCDKLEKPRSSVRAIGMPGPGSSSRTQDNAEKLAHAFGFSFESISINDAVEQHFKDIGHDASQHDITYENTQARQRTMVLMNLANKHKGFVVGTGDMSESALGWCTFNGDHMSMYHVNIGVPKTLVKHLVSWCAKNRFEGEISNTLSDIVDTPISPELLPPDAQGDIAQKTEDVVGPYELHDFYLYYTVRHPFRPGKVFMLAQNAFGEDYSDSDLLKWLDVFYRRFFSQQFKRSAMPDGPKVGTVALSPRGDWRMPSDAVADLWLDEVRRLTKQV